MTTGAVNLTVQVYDSKMRCDGYGGSYDYGEASVHGAIAALDAAEAPITRLTLRVESNGGGWHTHFADADVVGALVSHQASRHVEELRIAAGDVSDGFLYFEEEYCRHTGIHGEYGLASLPSSYTLRVLDLTRCNLTAAFPLPRLLTLRLRFCSVELKVLQALLDAAPELTTVQLEYVYVLPRDSQQNTRSHWHWPHPDELDDEAEAEPPVLRLSFQAATTLVLSSCGMQVQGSDGHRRGSSWAIEIDAPRLQSFRYKGLMRRFVLRPAAASVAQVDLHFLQDHDYKETIRAHFWQFLHNFTNARTVKLKVDNDLKDIAAVGEASGARILQCEFPGVERLELEGVFPSVECFDLQAMYYPERETAAVAIANLLDCCPVLGEFMLKLSAVPALPAKNARYGQEFLKRKDRSDYSKSIDRFVRRRKSKTAISMEASLFGDKYSYVDIPDIPGLSGRSFACLQRTLRRVCLQFRLDNNSISSCLGLRLIKFFADHARILEEMYVDTGNRRLGEHLNFNVETQIALAPIPISAIQHMSLAESLSEFSGISSASLDSAADLAKSTAGFTVLPLRRQERMDWKSSSLEN